MYIYKVYEGALLVVATMTVPVIPGEPMYGIQNRMLRLIEYIPLGLAVFAYVADGVKENVHATFKIYLRRSSKLGFL